MAKKKLNLPPVPDAILNATEGKRHKTGTKGKFIPEENWQIAMQMVRAGFTDEQICKSYLGITRRALVNRKKSEASSLLARASEINEWKKKADDKVERSLFERAVGCTTPDCQVNVIDREVVITPLTKHYPPDVTAAKFWLMNRKRKEWKEKWEVEAGDNLTGLLGSVIAEVWDKLNGPSKPPPGAEVDDE